MQLGYWRVLAGIVVLGFGRFAAADTNITGSHDNDGEGYEIDASGTYDVPADSGNTPSATFNNNVTFGLNINSNNVIANIEGGQFNDDSDGGVVLNAEDDVVNISAGQFENDSTGLSDGNGGNTINVSGGTFSGNDVDLFISPSDTATISGGSFESGIVTLSPVILTGGSFLENSDDFNLSGNGSLNVYGIFPGLSPGATENVTDDGAFTGQLENTPGTVTYDFSVNGNGQVVLNEVPEPASVGILAGVIASAGLVRRRGRGR